MVSTTDAIVKTTLLRAPIDRVWSAITDSRQFGTWFGIVFEGPFVAGQKVRGVVSPSKVNAEMAATQKSWEGFPFDVFVETVDPKRLFTFRWHPYETQLGSNEPTTLVTFELVPEADGIRLTITESGFDSIPLDRRAKAFANNEGGWNMQIKVVAEYVYGDYQ